MYRVKLGSAMSLFFVALVLSNWIGHAVNAQDMIPSTHAGKSLTALLESVNDDDESARDAFLSDGFLNNDEETLKKRKIQTDRVHSQLGKLTVKKIVSSSENRISVACKTSNGPNVILSVTTTDEEPYKIASVELEMGDGDEEGADDTPLNSEAKANVVNRLAKELRSKYVYPKVGEKMAVELETSQKDGKYTDIEDVREFASTLTDQLRDICNDKHLRVRAGVSRRPSRSSGRRPVDNHGFVKAEMLPGGVGYLKFNFFSGEEAAKKTASAAMNFLANSNTLIFDLRENGGGSPDMIAYLSSYLFDEPVHLNSFYNRPTETTTETWTQKDVPGKKFSLDTQVFVLTSAHTFSGAEEFSYNLKNLKRGTIVGETTGGGAHPVMPVKLGNRMHITMPFARAINPITETNWEGVGVKPDVEVSTDRALEKAIEIAKARTAQLAAKESRQAEKTETSNVDVGELAQKAADLMADESFEKAAEEFEKLTKLAPKQGRAWFNYGYCLHISGELDKAIEIHRKAAEFEQFAGIATYKPRMCLFIEEPNGRRVCCARKSDRTGLRRCCPTGRRFGFG